MALIGRMFECLVHSWSHCLRRIRTYDFDGGGMSLGANLEVSKAHIIPSQLPREPAPVDEEVSSQLFLPSPSLKL